MNPGDVVGFTASISDRHLDPMAVNEMADAEIHRKKTLEPENQTLEALIEDYEMNGKAGPPTGKCWDTRTAFAAPPASVPFTSASLPSIGRISAQYNTEIRRDQKPRTRLQGRAPSSRLHDICHVLTHNRLVWVPGTPATPSPHALTSIFTLHWNRHGLPKLRLGMDVGNSSLREMVQVQMDNHSTHASARNVILTSKALVMEDLNAATMSVPDLGFNLPHEKLEKLEQQAKNMEIERRRP
ncbi:hypothetical protein S40288_11135 [Stachybotrys chartarum IBT 40288]|nr:hypothetical protein S40288_11135 [Stachybotrys chartarum IBT 40288]